MDAAPAAIPPKPKIAAMIATTRKITVQRNIGFFLDLMIWFRTIRIFLALNIGWWWISNVGDLRFHCFMITCPVIDQELGPLVAV
jgi:hypothetical protein